MKTDREINDRAQEIVNGLDVVFSGGDIVNISMPNGIQKGNPGSLEQTAREFGKKDDRAKLNAAIYNKLAFKARKVIREARGEFV